MRVDSHRERERDWCGCERGEERNEGERRDVSVVVSASRSTIDIPRTHTTSPTQYPTNSISYQFNILSIQYPINPVSYQSNILSIQYPINPISYQSNILSIQYPINQYPILSTNILSTNILSIQYPINPISYQSSILSIQYPINPISYQSNILSTNILSYQPISYPPISYQSNILSIQFLLLNSIHNINRHSMTIERSFDDSYLQHLAVLYQQQHHHSLRHTRITLVARAIVA